MGRSGIDDPKGRVLAAANRLRAVQADFADADDSTRKEFLLEEIDRVLAEVVPDDRRVFLEQLQDRFPSWDQVDAKPQPAMPQSKSDAKELRDWTFLVEKLAALAPTMSEADRRSAARQLSAAGLQPEVDASGVGGWSSAQIAAVKAKLQLTPADRFVESRAAELLDLLCEFGMGLDLLAWNTWKQIAPQSATRRTVPLQRMLARFVAGDGECNRTQTAAEVAKLRRLLAAMISSVGQVGAKFAQDYCAQFAPSQIEDVVKAQGGGGLFGNAKVKFWDQYVQLAGARDAASVEHEFVTAFAEYAELLMKTAGR